MLVTSSADSDRLRLLLLLLEEEPNEEDMNDQICFSLLLTIELLPGGSFVCALLFDSFFSKWCAIFWA